MTDAAWCPVCYGEDGPALVGRRPSRLITGHARSCPVRGPHGERPRRVPRGEVWRPPPVVDAVLPADAPPAPALSPAAKRERAKELRAQGLNYPQIAAEVGCSTPHAWNLANGKR
jgi:hypothetical protein